MRRSPNSFGHEKQLLNPLHFDGIDAKSEVQRRSEVQRGRGGSTRGGEVGGGGSASFAADETLATFTAHVAASETVIVCCGRRAPVGARAVSAA